MATLEELKRKYQPVLSKAPELGFRLENLHIENNKLLMRGVVPSDFVKNKVWDEIKRVDTSFADLSADIRVQSGETYTVVPGDSLSKIAKRFYGDAKLYPKIFEANRDQIKDPDKIHVGWKIKLP